jgi:hypothetical protein
MLGARQNPVSLVENLGRSMISTSSDSAFVSFEHILAKHIRLAFENKSDNVTGDNHKANLKKKMKRKAKKELLKVEEMQKEETI